MYEAMNRGRGLWRPPPVRDLNSFAWRELRSGCTQAASPNPKLLNDMANRGPGKGHPTMANYFAAGTCLPEAGHAGGCVLSPIPMCRHHDLLVSHSNESFNPEG
jgi:hypothetical protein